MAKEQKCRWCGDQPCPVGYGKCHCGCGLDTTRSKKRENKRGLEIGDPARFIHEHVLSTIGKQRRQFTPEEVRTMRYRYAHENISQRQLAEEYNTSQPVMSRILSMETYKEIGI